MQRKLRIIHEVSLLSTTQNIQNKYKSKHNTKHKNIQTPIVPTTLTLTVKYFTGRKFLIYSI